MFAGFKAIARGASHREKNLPCQDAVYFKQYKNGGLAIVADGHGSEKHFRSGTGAEIAVQTAQEAIVEFAQLLGGESRERYRDRRRMEDQIKQLERTVITRWRQRVLSHFEDNPLAGDEKVLCEAWNVDSNDDNDRVRAYGTTLIAAMLQKAFWFIVQIGDGKAVMLDGKRAPSFVVPEDESMGFGKTTSLCDSAAGEHFRESFGYDAISGLTVATDGVSDSFIPGAYLEFHKQLYADFFRNPGPAEEGIQKGIVKWSENGSRDDAAMAGVFYRPDGRIAAVKELLFPNLHTTRSALQ